MTWTRTEMAARAAREAGEVAARAAEFAREFGAELVCVDGDRGWTTTLRIAGRFVLVIDQEHGGGHGISSVVGSATVAETGPGRIGRWMERAVPSPGVLSMSRPPPSSRRRARMKRRP